MCPPALRSILYIPKTAPPEFYEKYYEKGPQGTLPIQSRAGMLRKLCTQLCTDQRLD